MTFNIRYGRAPDGPHAWPLRRDLVLDRIRTFDPDLLGLQECLDNEQADFIRTSLPDYHFIGFQRGGQGESAAEMAPIVIRRAAFDLLDSGCFWLSETPEVPGSSSWGAALPRPITWAILQRRGAPFLFINAHYDHASSRARAQSSLVLLQQARQLAPGLPLILCGDFNARKTSLAYRRLTEEGGLQDALRLTQPVGAPQGTFHNFGALTRLEPLDWILASPHFRPIQSAIDRTIFRDLYPSDHYPVTALLEPPA